MSADNNVIPHAISLASPASSLPATVKDLLNQRRSPPVTTLSDRVESIYLKLYEDPVFKQYRQAIYREDTAEGTFVDDDVMAAQMIKSAASKAGASTTDFFVAKEKLSVIRRLLGVVERRYNADRKSRLRREESSTPAAQEDSDD
jgi:hypothetical protein